MVATLPQETPCKPYIYACVLKGFIHSSERCAICLSVFSVESLSVVEPTMEEGGWGIGSVVAMLVVAAVLFFAPLGMGPVQPPSGLILLIFPVVLIAIFIFLSYASK
ncbi:hypothetical protein SLA2020_516880 [Shorea laevis]